MFNWIVRTLLCWDNAAGGITPCCKLGIRASTSIRCAWKTWPSELLRSINVHLMEANMLPLGRRRTVGLAPEEFESASKPASLFATPQQETIWQTYLAECDEDVCLLSPLSTTQNCVINYYSQGDVGVGGAASPGRSPLVHAFQNRCTQPTSPRHLLTQNECKIDLQWHEFAKKDFHILFQNNSQKIHFTL